MPNRDGTGPFGKGPRTGRGLGKCKLRGKTSNIGKNIPKMGIPNTKL